MAEKKKKVKKEKKTSAEKWKDLKKKSDAEFFKKVEKMELKEWWDSDKPHKPHPPGSRPVVTLVKQLRKRK